MPSGIILNSMMMIGIKQCYPWTPLAFWSISGCNYNVFISNYFVVVHIMSSEDMSFADYKGRTAAEAAKHDVYKI